MPDIQSHWATTEDTLPAHGLLKRLRSYLPSGGILPPEVWKRRCRFLTALAWFHAGVIAMIGPLYGYSWELSPAALFRDDTVLHTVFEGGVVALFAAFAALGTSRSFQAAMLSLGLMTSSAVLVHLSGGYIEVHFHFFVMLAFLALLQDWLPYLLAILYVALHHGVLGVLWPADVYNHTAALNAPWTWAGIHAFFILWASAGSVVAWRFNESALQMIKRQAEELDRLNKLQADFAAMMAHDLRGPLTTVVPTAAMLEDGLFGPVSEEQKKWLKKIQTSCLQLVEIVNDFLDLSKIEAGQIHLFKEMVDLRDIIRHNLETYLPMADAKNVALRARLAPDLPELQVDPRRIDQVLSNLISNAVKFTPAGGEIEVGAKRDDHRIQIWVKDNGLGIAASDLESLFEKYKQTQTGRESRQKGTGLGLLICKKLVEAHNGSIGVQSEPGKGSTFMLTLPRSDQERMRAAAILGAAENR
jgi:signal transduction histidine kinase